MLACALPALGQAPPLEVSVRRIDEGGQHVYEVAASGAVQASPGAVWKILTDYERMPDFVPDLQSSRVLSRSGNRVIVEQVGKARFLFFRRTINLVVDITEHPTSRIDIGLVNGDMKVYECHWELVPVAETGGTRVNYSGKLVPRFYVPGMLGASAIRSDIERMMKAVLERLDQAS